MTDEYAAGSTMAAAAPTRPQTPTDTGQLRAAGLLFVGLAVLGCLLGPVWSWWSPPGPLGERIPAGVIADETEAFIAADGRFALLTTVVGLVAGIVMWFVRSVRGPWIVAALGLGGLVGAVLTGVVGHAVRGRGQQVRVTAQVSRIDHLPLQVHAGGLLLLEGAAAALAYGLCAAFAAHDDLGRPDPARDALAGSFRRDSVHDSGKPDDCGGDGDAAAALQQRDLPAQ